MLSSLSTGLLFRSPAAADCPTVAGTQPLTGRTGGSGASAVAAALDSASRSPRRPPRPRVKQTINSKPSNPELWSETVPQIYFHDLEL